MKTSKNKRAKEYRARIRKEIRQEIQKEKKQWFNATTLEQRKVFMSLLHDGYSIKEAGDRMGFSLQTALVVLDRNKKIVRTIRYNLPEEVV
jgi:DNA-directed RNA polymerase specialized sigma24 family protein